MSNPPRVEVSRKEVEAAFAMCNPSNGDYIKIADLKLVMRALGYDPRNAQVEEFAKRLREIQKKKVGHGVVDCMNVDEFLELMRDKIDADKSTEEMRCAFKLFDREGKGWISIDNLREVARELGESLKEDELAEMLDEAGSDGKVDEQAFFTIMKRTCLY